MRQLDFLADARELIYYDARGSGQTDVGDTQDLTFARAIADLEGLRAGLGIVQFSVLSRRRLAVPTCPGGSRSYRARCLRR
jgi:pimeloyl-ACP methyl ester carboxylesterase